MPRTLIAAITLAAWTLSAHAAPALRHIAIENGEGLEYVRTVPKPVTYRNVKALQLVAAADNDSVALVKDLDFKDGALEVDLAGLPGPGAANTARGFVGVAFRSAPHAAAFDCFYLRPTNGRADDQLRRNHSAQYVSEPDYGWERLRTQTPGVYESYVDLEAGAWTTLRIEVEGGHARLFVNGSKQPVLVVNDMKGPPAVGRVALWIDAGTDAHFSRLRVTPSK